MKRLRFLPVLAGLVSFLGWSAHAAADVSAPADVGRAAVRDTATDSDSSATRPADDGMVEKRRILRLASGQTIRVLARQVDGQWQYKNKSGWRALEAGAVVSVALERDVLAEWNARRSRLDTRKADERAQLAAFGVERGLAAEALAELEGVLALEPDHPLALATLRGNWFFSVPTIRVEEPRRAVAEEELLRFGAAQTTCGRELAVSELEHHPDRAALEKRLGSELASSVVSRRAFATLALRRLFPTTDARPLLVRAVLDASPEVRTGAALALKAAGDPALTLPMVRALGSRSPTVRVRAAEALGFMGYAIAVEPLVAALKPAPPGGGGSRLPHATIFVGQQTAYVQDFDVEVASFQAVADPQINVYHEGMSTEAAVLGVHEVSFATESAAIGRALGRLTGEQPGHTARAWLAWWEKNGAAWRARDAATTPAGVPTVTPAGSPAR